MKIYPSEHVVKTITDKYYDTDLNLPLAYVNIDFTKYDIATYIDNKFNISSSRLLVPGDKFDREDVKIFNEFREEVLNEDVLSRQGDSFVYVPKRKVEFKPHTFYYQAVIKRTMNYRIANSYNINVGCVDDPDSLTLSNTLAKIFTNPSQRNLVPPNISINDNHMTAYDFTNMTLANADFLFIETPDGLRYEDTDDSELIDFNSILDNNVNTWLCVEDHHLYKYDNIGEGREFQIKNPIINANSKVTSDVFFDIQNMPALPGVVIHNPFVQNNPPLLVIETVGKNFTVISHRNILEQVHMNTNLFYEIMMYIYVRTYDSTPKVKEWICNKVPDYQIENGNLVNKKNFVSSFDIGTYFNLKASEMQIADVHIIGDPDNKLPDLGHDLYTDTAEIKYIGMSGNKLMFEKEVTMDSIKTEPDKPVGWKGIYNGTTVMYVDKIYYTYEDSLDGKIFTIESDENLKVKIMPFISSSNALNIKTPTDLLIPFIIAENEYIKKVKQASYTIYMTKEQEIKFAYEEDYDSKNIKLFDIKITQTPDAVEIYDMRQLGGGLKEDELDNFNLLDIGNMQGRPYRKAGTIVFTMPKKYEPHREIILEAINEYIGADEYAALFFEDKENE